MAFISSRPAAMLGDVLQLAIALMLLGVDGRETVVRCWKLPDLTEFCDYRHVCYAPSVGLMIGRDGIGADQRLGVINQGSLNPYSHVVKEDYLNDGMMPWRAFVGGVVVHPDRLDDAGNVWARANTTLLLTFDADVPNLFHTSEKVLGGHGALWFLNQQADDAPGEYDAVHLRRTRASLGAWEHRFLGIMFERAHASGQLTFSDTGGEYDDGERLLCFRRLVVPGTAIFFHGGPTQAAETRALVYRAALGGVVPLCDRRLVTIVQRRGSRRIVNLDDAIDEVVARLGVPFQVVELEALDFDEQVRVMAETRVLVAVHGAGLANVPFLQPNGVVLELFAYNYVYQLYHNIATAAGLFHLTYEAARHETLYHGEAPPDRHSSYLCLIDGGGCAAATKNADLRLDLDRFAASLQLVLSMVGPCH